MPFGNEGLNAGRTEDGHISFGRINSLADGLGNISKVIENGLEIL